MNEITAYERIYLEGKQAERERILAAIEDLKSWNDNLTYELVFVKDLEEAINGK